MEAAKSKINNILVAIDFSKSSDLAIAKAIDIAKTTKAKLTILHVIQKKSIDRFIDGTLKKILPKALLITAKEHASKRLTDKVTSLLYHGVEIKTVLATEVKASLAILKLAKKNKCDLLVMGAHGKFSFRDTFVGTTAEYIAKKTPCPLLIVKSESQAKYRKVIMPTDFSKHSKNSLNYACEIFPKANFRLLHVGDYDFEDLLQKERIKAVMPRNKISKLRESIMFYLKNKMKIFTNGIGEKLGKFSTEIVLGYPGPCIIKAARAAKSDVIVMGTKGSGRHHYLFMGSVAQWVLTDCDRDLLLVPPNTKA